MKKRAAVKGQKQQENPVAMSTAMQQLMLPLLLAMDATKKGLLSFVQQMGMVVLSELLVAEAAQIAGPKGKHVEGRTHHHWGAGTTPVSFGGRHVPLPHTRVRARGTVGAERSRCRASRHFVTATRCLSASSNRSHSASPRAVTNAAWSRWTRARGEGMPDIARSGDDLSPDLAPVASRLHASCPGAGCARWGGVAPSTI